MTMHAPIEPLEDNAYVLCERTHGLGELHVVWPEGWSSEPRAGASRLLAELFGRGTHDADRDELQRAMQALSCSIDLHVTDARTRLIIAAHEEVLLDAVALAIRLIDDFAVANDELARAQARLNSEVRSIPESPEVIADLGLRHVLWPGERLALPSSGDPRARLALRGADIEERWRQIRTRRPLLVACTSNASLGSAVLKRLGDACASAGRTPGPTTWSMPGLPPARDRGQWLVDSAMGMDCLRIVRTLPPLGVRHRACLALVEFGLVGGFMGALYQELRTERHLVYAISTRTTLARDYSLWILELSPSPGRSAEVLAAIPDAIDALAATFAERGIRELVARYDAHSVHQLASWRSRLHAVRQDLEYGRAATETMELPALIQRLTSDEVAGCLRDWNHASEPRVELLVAATENAPKWRSLPVDAFVPQIR